MIEPNGEGVIAGRAAPGWQVSVQSSGTKVAAATADAQGEWSAVLDKPLPAGDHALTLKITSPDGTRALSSQELVRVEVGDGANRLRRLPRPQHPRRMRRRKPPRRRPPGHQARRLPRRSKRLRWLWPSLRAKPARFQDLPSRVPRRRRRNRSWFSRRSIIENRSAIGSVSITGTSDPGATIGLLR